MTCIYCRADKSADSFRKAEHVIPQSFGRFKDNFTLRGSVCDDCNQYFGDNLELALGRDTVEGLSRVDFGIQKPEDFKSLSKANSRLAIRVAEGPVKGAYAFREFSDEVGSVIVKSAPQIGIRKAGSTEYEFFLIRNMPHKDSLDATHFDLSDPHCFFIVGLDSDAAKQILESKGFRFQLAEHGPPPEKEPLDGLFELEQTVDFVIARAIAKIAFNYLAFWEDRDFLLDRSFNMIRRFIRCGEKPPHPVVVVDDTPILADEPVEGRSRLGHLVTVNWANDGCSIVSQVSLFNWVRYSVCVAPDFPGARRNIRRGHFFNVHGREILKLEVRP